MSQFVVGLRRRATEHSVAVYHGTPSFFESTHDYILGPFPDWESADLFRQFADQGSESFKLLREVMKACMGKPSKLKQMLVHELAKHASSEGASTPSLKNVAVPQLPEKKE